MLLGYFKAEAAAYNALNEQQGKTVPRFLGVVQLDLLPAEENAATNPVVAPQVNNALDIQPFQVNGILLQYIDGFSLRQVSERCPRSAWQGIVDQAVSIVRLHGDYNTLNGDVRFDNFVISPTANGEGEQQYHVFMIDFGHCRIRRKEETDLEWGRDNYTADEDGAVGLIMRMILKRDYGFDLHYERSEQYAEWADTDESHSEGTVKTTGSARQVVLGYQNPQTRKQDHGKWYHGSTIFKYRVGFIVNRTSSINTAA